MGSSLSQRRSYCAGQGRNGQPGFLSFRAVDDLLDEMQQIMTFLRMNHPDFVRDNIYFLPANEPNSEWYEPGWWAYPQQLSDPYFQMQVHEINQEGTLAWNDMNRFFSALYRRKQARGLNDIRVLTPPMGGDKQSEAYTPLCQRQQFAPFSGARSLVVGGGYEQLLQDDPTTLELEGMLRPELNDGYSWNNYWNPGREAWAMVDEAGHMHSGCNNRPEGTPAWNDHLVQRFPPALQTMLRNDFAVIIEADLASPFSQNGQIPAPSKDAFGNYGSAAAQSIERFVQAEVVGNGTDRVGIWLLTVDFNEPTDNVSTCTALDNNATFRNAGREYLWHQAYLANGTECHWFRSLWVPPASRTRQATMSILHRETPVSNPPIRSSQGVLTETNVRLGTPVEVASMPGNIPPGYRLELPYDGRITRLFLTNTVISETLRLGNDQGSAYFFDMNERYVLWGFLCHIGCNAQEPPALPTGYYLFDLTTRAIRPFTAANTHGMALGALGTEWVAFASAVNADNARLYAGHITTGEVITLTESLQFPGRAVFRITSQRPFAIDSNTVVWTNNGLYTYDLTARTERLLDVPAQLTPEKGYEIYDPSPRHLRLSSTALVWYSQWSWWGYDLVTNQAFAIPDTFERWNGRPDIVHRFLRQADIVDDRVFLACGCANTGWHRRICHLHCSDSTRPASYKVAKLC